jgi:methionyl-tRNA formyltransferase
MRIVMLGTGSYAVPTLQALAAANEHEIALVVTRPPRGRQSETSPVGQAAAELGIEVWSPDSVNTSESQLRLAGLRPDLLVVCDYGEILRAETLAAARLGGINLHGSLLPRYRGAAPVQWAILRGERQTGNTVIRMTSGLDAGPCLGQQRIEIDAEEDAVHLEGRLAAMGAELVLQVVRELAGGTARPVEQDRAQASKAPRLKKEDGVVDWSRPAQAIKNQVRALRPWPRATTFWYPTEGDPVRLIIDRVAILSGRSTSEAAAPGTVIEATERLVIATGDAALELLDLQPAGKRAMSAGDFLRGNRVVPGDRFGPA